MLKRHPHESQQPHDCGPGSKGPLTIPKADDEILLELQYTECEKKHSLKFSSAKTSVTELNRDFGAQSEMINPALQVFV